MAILFVGNSAADLGGNMVGFPSRTGGPETVDSNYPDPMHDADFSHEAAGVKSDRNAARFGFAINTDDPGGDYWFHCRVVPPSASSSSSADGHWWEFLDSEGEVVARIDVQDGEMRPMAWGDTTEYGATGSTVISYVPVTIDVRVAVGANIDVDFYVNGSLVSSASSVNTGGKGSVRTVSADHDEITSGFEGSDTWVFYSEVIVMGNESTVGMRLATLEPDVDGFHTDMTGSVSNIMDANDGAVLSSDTAGDKQSWTLTAYQGPTTPTSIRAMVTAYKGSTGITGPQNARPFFRIGGTDYNGTDESPLPEGNMEVWDNNPDTGTAWDTADFSGIEQGIEVRA